MSLDLSLEPSHPKLHWRLTYRVGGIYRKADVTDKVLSDTLRKIADLADASRIVVTPLPQ